VAKPSDKESELSKPPALRVFPMGRRPGDILADEIAEWRVIAQSNTTAGGKTVNVRVESAKQPGVTQMRAWGAHERVGRGAAGRPSITVPWFRASRYKDSRFLRTPVVVL
jgi:hypothetical protein